MLNSTEKKTTTKKKTALEQRFGEEEGEIAQSSGSARELAAFGEFGANKWPCQPFVSPHAPPQSVTPRPCSKDSSKDRSKDSQLKRDTVRVRVVKRGRTRVVKRDLTLH